MAKSTTPKSSPRPKANPKKASKGDKTYGTMDRAAKKYPATFATSGSVRTASTVGKSGRAGAVARKKMIEEVRTRKGK